MSITDENRERFYMVLASIPAGKVITYGQLAAQADQPGKARWVGQMLSHLPNDTKLPWHRVINAQGQLSFVQGSEIYDQQRRLLEAEGVEFGIDGEIDLIRFGWI